jgi:serine/threonine protein phosphatase PrpC
MKSLSACATQTNKSTINQDSYDVVVNEVASFKGIIVADGIGSHPRSELSSSFCVKSLKNKLQSLIQFDEVQIKLYFSEIQSELKTYAQSILNESELTNNPLGTTLLLLLELETEYFCAYVGNGCIWQIQGNFNHFGINRYLPWNAINILNPHTIEKDGQSALYKFISIHDSISCNPSIIRISKNDDSFGDIIIIASDGVYTNDDSKIGKDDNDVIWIMGEETISILFNKLNSLFTKDSNSFEDSDLQVFLNDYLTDVKENKIMHDDTTIGMIISPRALQHQQFKRNKERNDDEANSN